MKQSLWFFWVALVRVAAILLFLMAFLIFLFKLTDPAWDVPLLFGLVFLIPSLLLLRWCRNAKKEASSSHRDFKAPETTAVPAPGATGKPQRVVTCPGCGAGNTLHSATGECEFCGSPLS